MQRKDVSDYQVVVVYMESETRRSGSDRSRTERYYG